VSSTNIIDLIGWEILSAKLMIAARKSNIFRDDPCGTPFSSKIYLDLCSFILT